jgi:dihydrolipoamide dehydrogenase
MNANRFDNIMLKTKTGAEATPEGIKVTFAPADEGGTTPRTPGVRPVLQAVGRTPNGKKIAAERLAWPSRTASSTSTSRCAPTCRTSSPSATSGSPLAHKAVHEAHVAAEVIAGELQGNKELASAAFNARVIPSVAYTDPEVAWVGLTEDQAKRQGIKVKKGLFPWAASGRAIANGRDEGVTKLLFDDSPEAGSGDGHAGRGHGKILGGGMVGTHAGDMIGEIALAIEMGADAVDIGKTIHPHPTLGESIGMAAEVAHGSCTDVPPARK